VGITHLGVGVVARNEAAVRFFVRKGFVTAYEIKGLLVDTTFLEKR
jgi:hypothetical protein